MVRSHISGALQLQTSFRGSDSCYENLTQKLKKIDQVLGQMNDNVIHMLNEGL